MKPTCIIQHRAIGKRKPGVSYASERPCKTCRGLFSRTKLQTPVWRWSGSPECSSRFRLVAERIPHLLLGESHCLILSFWLTGIAEAADFSGVWHFSRGSRFSSLLSTVADDRESYNRESRYITIVPWFSNRLFLPSRWQFSPEPAARCNASPGDRR